MIRLSALDISGSPRRLDDATHVVTFYYIPTGKGDDEGHLTTIYYTNEKAAQDFVNRWEGYPHCAELMAIEEYDRTSEQIKLYTK